MGTGSLPDSTGLSDPAPKGRTLRYPAERGEGASAGNWQKAVVLALINGAREDLAPLVVAGPTFARPDGSAFTAYREVLHAYPRGAEPEAAAQRAPAGIREGQGLALPDAAGRAVVPARGGDAESFNLALADALEAHRASYQVADRADDPDASLSLDILALTCHARRRSWDIRVESPYLPPNLLQAAEPYQQGPSDGSWRHAPLRRGADVRRRGSDPCHTA